MPADRLIHPRAGHSVKVSSLTDFQFRVWMQYLLSSDDFGVMRADALTLQAHNDALAKKPLKVVQRALDSLVTCRLLFDFEHQGRRYVCQHDWQRWQKVEYPRATIEPKPADVDALDDATRALFDKHPGGLRRRNEDIPKTSRISAEGVSNVSQRHSKGVPTTRARRRAKRLTLTANANGVRPTADGFECEPAIPTNVTETSESGLISSPASDVPRKKEEQNTRKSLSQPSLSGSIAVQASIHPTHHRAHASCGRVCVPAFLHDEFRKRRNHDNADMELRDWYLAIDGEWAIGGPKADQEPGEPLSFWRARYEERWPGPAAARGGKQPAWMTQKSQVGVT